MFTSPNTNFPGGVTNAAPYQAMAKAGTPDPSWSQLYHNEFNTYIATDLTTTLVGAGTTALVAESGGVLLSTTAAGIADANYHQLPVAGFAITPGSQLFFKARLKMDSATLSTVFAGLIIQSATPLAAADGLYFLKATGAATWVLRSSVGGVNVDTVIPVGLVAVANTWIEVAFYYDGQGNVAAYINPTTGPSVPAANAPKGFVAKYSPAAGFTTAILTPSFGHLNSTAVARTLRCDYLTVSNELVK
jgi:hypothetical protein